MFYNYKQHTFRSTKTMGDYKKRSRFINRSIYKQDTTLCDDDIDPISYDALVDGDDNDPIYQIEGYKNDPENQDVIVKNRKCYNFSTLRKWYETKRSWIDPISSEPLTVPPPDKMQVWNGEEDDPKWIKELEHDTKKANKAVEKGDTKAAKQYVYRIILNPVFDPYNVSIPGWTQYYWDCGVHYAPKDERFWVHESLDDLVAALVGF